VGFTLSGGDNRRLVHGGEWIAETQRRTTYCRDLQYGSWSKLTLRLILSRRNCDITLRHVSFFAYLTNTVL